MSLTPYLDPGENFMQFGMKTTAHAFSHILLLLLVGAWIITGPVLSLLDDITYAAKQFTDSEKAKGRSENQGASARMTMAAVRQGTGVRLPA